MVGNLLINNKFSVRMIDQLIGRGWIINHRKIINLVSISTGRPAFAHPYSLILFSSIVIVIVVKATNIFQYFFAENK